MTLSLRYRCFLFFVPDGQGRGRGREGKTVIPEGQEKKRKTGGVSMLSLQFSHLTAGVSVLYDPR